MTRTEHRAAHAPRLSCLSWMSQLRAPSVIPSIHNLAHAVPPAAAVAVVAMLLKSGLAMSALKGLAGMAHCGGSGGYHHQQPRASTYADKAGRSHDGAWTPKQRGLHFGRGFHQHQPGASAYADKAGCSHDGKLMAPP